jgi:ribosomal protein L11
MTETNKKYALAFGYRRFTACKKLGWKTIPAFIKETNEIKDLPMDSINIIDNTRLESSADEEFTELMQSVKQNGLLQPIGVWDIKNMDKKDFIILNVTENIHRKNISPYELAKAIQELTKLGLNKGEIAVRLSISRNRVDSMYRLITDVPASIIKETSFNDGNKSERKGKIPLTTMNAIVTFRTSKSNKEKLIDIAKKEELSSAQMGLITDFMRQGYEIEQAREMQKHCVVTNITLVLDNEIYQKCKYQNMNMNQIVNGIITGQLEPIPKLFKFNRKIKVQ